MKVSSFHKKREPQGVMYHIVGKQNAARSSIKQQNLRRQHVCGYRPFTPNIISWQERLIDGEVRIK